MTPADGHDRTPQRPDDERPDADDLRLKSPRESADSLGAMTTLTMPETNAKTESPATSAARIGNSRFLWAVPLIPALPPSS